MTKVLIKAPWRPKRDANNRFNQSNEARTDIATSVIFGLLAVSNQHPLEC